MKFQLLILALLTGCAGPVPHRFALLSEHHLASNIPRHINADRPPIPKAPEPLMIQTGAVGERVAVEVAGAFNVSLAWNNYPDFGHPWRSCLLAGIEASQDRTNWTEIGTWPYEAVMSVTISNRPSDKEFYRSFWRPLRQ